MSMYYIKHNYRDKIILPLVGILDNFNFFTKNEDEETFVKTADGVIAKVVQMEEKHIVELEDEIKEIYQIDAWSFLKKWYNSDNGMQSARFVKLILNKK